MKKRCLIWLAMLAGATSAWAQPSTPKPQGAAPPVESVVVNGASTQAVNSFVQSVATPTHTVGKVARWEDPICPYALGLPDDVTAIVVKRVKALAMAVGAKVSSNAVCKPNLIIAFTSTPQALLNSIRADHPMFLGYHAGPADLDRLATVTHPIQAWYSTATVDLQGHREVDDARTDSTDPGLILTGSCAILGTQRVPTPTALGVMNLPNPAATCTVVLPNATRNYVRGSRIADDLHAVFDHVTIVADPSAVTEGMATLNDYIAMLALAQMGDPARCQNLPSIANLLARDCQQGAKELTANDLNYLKGLYHANPAQLLGLQMGEIARRMEQGGSQEKVKSQ